MVVDTIHSVIAQKSCAVTEYKNYILNIENQDLKEGDKIIIFEILDREILKWEKVEE